MARENAKKRITQKMLQTPLRQWKKRLGLQDWEVKIVIVKEINHHNPDTQATCSVEPEMKRATIMMCREDDNPISTLVHELLHIHTNPFEEVLDKNGEAYLREVYLEQVIETLAKALTEGKDKE